MWALLTESGSGSPQKSLPEHQLVMQLLNGLQKEILNVDDEISKVEEEEESIENEIEMKNRLDSSVTVYFDAPEAGRTTLSLTYLVNNVSFKPCYDINASLSEREEINDMRVVYQASLQQSSGEDWNDVVLKVSTFNPTENVDIPHTIHPLKWIPPESHYTSTSYCEPRELITLPGRYTISHNTKTQKIQNVVIADLNFTNVKLDHIFLTHRPKDVFLRATVINTSNRFLPGGSANIMLDGTLVGNTTIPVSSHYQL